MLNFIKKKIFDRTTVFLLFSLRYRPVTTPLSKTCERYRWLPRLVQRYLSLNIFFYRYKHLMTVTPRYSLTITVRYSQLPDR